MSDSTQTILKSAKHFFSGTVLSRISGMLRDMMMAYAFGTQASIAGFMLAFRFSHLLRRLFGEGALQSAFVPEFEALRYQSATRAFSFFRNLAALLMLFLSMIILIFSLIIGAFLLYGQLQEGTQDILFLTALMLPSLFFICLFGLNASLLQCEKNYFTPSVAPVAFNLIWIIVVFFLRHIEESQAMPWMASGIIVACFFQWAITVPKTIEILKKNLLSNWWKDIQLFSSDIVKMGKPLLLGIIGVGASQINNAIDGLFARFADAEGPALLWYSIRIQQLPLALFGIAISGALLPPLSRAIKAHDWSQYQQFLQYALQQTAALMIPATLFLLISGDACINLIYGRGGFDSASIAGTTLCLWAYGAGLIPMALVLMLAPACYAQNDYRLPAYASFLTMGLNCLLNSWMISGLGLGATSVALATSISAWVNLFFLGFSLSKKNGPIMNSSLKKYLVKIGLASFIAGSGVVLLRIYLHDFALIDMLKQQTPDFSRNFGKQCGEMFWQGTFFWALYGCFFLINENFSKIYHRLNDAENIS